MREPYVPEPMGTEELPVKAKVLRMRYLPEQERVLIVFQFLNSICSIGVSLNSLENWGLIVQEERHEP